MKVLVGCEESQIVCAAFRKMGCDAYSCDLEPTRGNPKWHFQQDIMTIIPTSKWDIIILFPDCTAMTVSGNKHYGKDKEYYYKRQQAIKWTLSLWELANKYCLRVALENPVSVIFNHLPNVHYIHPWQFGHGEVKRTGLALHYLPLLRPTNIVEGKEQRIWKMAPSPTRKRDRSETYQGIADAMAEQWTKKRSGFFI